MRDAAVSLARAPDRLTRSGFRLRHYQIRARRARRRAILRYSARLQPNQPARAALSAQERSAPLPASSRPDRLRRFPDHEATVSELFLPPNYPICAPPPASQPLAYNFVIT